MVEKREREWQRNGNSEKKKKKKEARKVYIFFYFFFFVVVVVSIFFYVGLDRHHCHAKRVGVYIFYPFSGLFFRSETCAFMHEQIYISVRVHKNMR